MDHHHHHSGHGMDNMMNDQTTIPTAQNPPLEGMDPHGGHQGGGHSMMNMVFHFSTSGTVLFDQWTFSTTQGLLFAMFGIIIMGAVYETLKFFREYLFWQTYKNTHYRAVTIPSKLEPKDPNNHVHRRILNQMHCLQTILHILQLTLSYLLMLIFMTYNIWLCLAVVIGSGIGYFLFSWKKSTFLDLTDHCH